MNTPLVDCHTHASFSDGTSTFEENVRAAAAAGLSVLACTDHLTLPASMERVADAQVPLGRLCERRAAFEAARELAAEVAPSLTVVYGFECDWYPGCEPNVACWAQDVPFTLGSVHWVGDAGNVEAGATGQPGTEGVELAGQPGSGAGWIDFSDDLHIWQELGPDEVWRRYVDAWCAACESPLNFSSMAHPDLPACFANDGLAPTVNLEPLWERMAACAHDTHRHVEVSSAGLRKSTGAFYPSAGLLRAFARAEVPLTVGSDAHRSCDVGHGIAAAYRYAAAAGYASIDAPRADGSWVTLPLR